MNVHQVETFSFPLFREKLRRKKSSTFVARVCPCCSQWFSRLALSAYRSWMEPLLYHLTGLTKVEGLLLGLSTADLLFLQRPTPQDLEVQMSRRPLNSAVIKRIEYQVQENAGSVVHGFGESPEWYQDSQLSHHSEAIAETLGIRPTFRLKLEEAIQEICGAYAARKTLLDLQRVPFNRNNQGHRQRLEHAWVLLTDQQRLPSWDATTSGADDFSQRVSWCDIGFQSEDPTRDFRGAGILGCLNIEWFAEHQTLRARQLLRESNVPDRQGPSFPFAATSINVTVWLVAFLETGYLDVFFYNNPMPATDIFHIIYAFVFLEFSRFWKVSRPANILQFGRVTRLFLTHIESCLSDISNPESHSEWSVPLTSTGQELTEELRCWMDGNIGSRGVVNRASGGLCSLQETAAGLNGGGATAPAPPISTLLTKLTSAPQKLSSVPL